VGEVGKPHPRKLKPIMSDNQFQENLITRAAELARKLHALQKRKSSGEPVFYAHLVPVSQLVAEYGGSAEAIAASLLHDAIEDQGDATRAQILGICGPEVLAIVEECTEEGTGGGYDKKPDWHQRKESYLSHLAQVSPEALLVSIADKTQSAEELAGDVETKGDAAYEVFKTGKGGSLWFHWQLWEAFSNRVEALGLQETQTEALLDRFGRAVKRLV
jgi:(p)ppGpp synthase/HD superfamily hydrolase